MTKSRLRANIHFCSRCFDISLGELCLGHHDQNSKQKRVQNHPSTFRNKDLE